MTNVDDAERAELVTVLVPARNEELTLGACLDSVLAQEYQNLQVVVVDGASTDSTRDVVLAYREADQRVELVLNDRANIPASLNLGLDAAKGTWLVRVDAHSVIPPGYVQRAVMRLREGSWGGVGGRKSGRGETLQGRAIAVALGSRFGVGNSLYHYGTEEQETDHVPFGSYPVGVLRGLGGWNETLLANEDFEFDLRLREAGHRLLFDPELSIDWKSRQTLSALFSQYHRYGRSKFPVARLHPGSLRARHLVPPALVAYLAAAGVVGLWRPVRGAAMVAPYAGGLVIASAIAGRHLPLIERAVLPPAFGSMHIGWGAGFWHGVSDVLLSGRGSRR
ncbi:MAG: glycosyltransferase family 2 protein [Actinomycetes bacterium]